MEEAVEKVDGKGRDGREDWEGRERGGWKGKSRRRVLVNKNLQQYLWLSYAQPES